VADAGDGRIAILLGVLGQELVGDELAVRPARHDVRERAAPIDPELPALSVQFHRRFIGVSSAVIGAFNDFLPASLAPPDHSDTCQNGRSQRYAALLSALRAED
jgi:hypothetical protein